MKSASNTVTLSSKHQVVVPAEIRAALGLKPGAKLDWIATDGAIQLIPHLPASHYRGIARGLKDSLIPNEADRI